MKKLMIIFVSLICTLSFLVGCGSATNQVEVKPVLSENTVVSAEQADKNLQLFLGVSGANVDGNLGNRTYTSQSANDAAQLLAEHFSNKEKYPNVKTEKVRFSHKYESKDAYNVVVEYAAAKRTDNQIIIGACYDTAFGNLEKDSPTAITTGAMKTGTGVATVMSLIDYCNDVKPELTFNIQFVFFAGAYGCIGSLEHYGKLPVVRQANTMLMVNIQRLGGEKMYVYSEEVPTKHNQFILEQGNSNGTNFYSIPKSMPIMQKRYLDSVNYMHFAMVGDHAPFMLHDIPVANIFSADLGGLQLGFTEKQGESNLSDTINDTYTNLKKQRPEYANQMAEVAATIIKTISATDFTSIMIESKTTVYDYSWATVSWVASLAVFVILAGLLILLILLVKHFEKKYPYEPKVKKLKIAVFGMDYEKKSEDDIFVDIKKPPSPFDNY